MLDRLRERLEGTLEKIGRLFSRIVGNPIVWTIAGFLFSLLSGISFSSEVSGRQIIGGVMVLFSGSFDVVDGAVARVTGKTSKSGAFLDSTLDRLAEVAVFVGILGGNLAPPVIVVLALSLSLLVSYARAKGDALGVNLSGIGIGERSERMLILALFSIAGYVALGVALVALVAGYTFIERSYRALGLLS